MGGMFYPATPREAKRGNGKWKRFKRGGVTTPQDKAFRDVHVFKAVWNALCKDGTAAEFLKMRQRCSSACWGRDAVDNAREAFGKWYDSFYQHMGEHTQGWFGDYSMKCILDVGCNCSIQKTKDGKQVFPDAALSRWPVGCPAYEPGLKKVLKPAYKKAVLKAGLKYKLLMYVHAKMSKRLGAATHRVPSTLAALCWDKRAKKKKRKTRR